MYDIEKLNNKKVAELREIAEKLNIQKIDKLKKQELVYKILDEQAMHPKKEVAKSEDEKEKTNRNSEVRKPSNEKRAENASKPQKMYETFASKFENLKTRKHFDVFWLYFALRC